MRRSRSRSPDRYRGGGPPRDYGRGPPDRRYGGGGGYGGGYRGYGGGGGGGYGDRGGGYRGYGGGGGGGYGRGPPRGRSRSPDRPRYKNRDISSSRERSRERERHRRRAQTKCIQSKAGGANALAASEGKTTTQLFWDGFQWVAKNQTTQSNVAMDSANMQNTRKARRLYVGNIPMQMGLTEAQFQDIIWHTMKERNLCSDPHTNPVMCVWFAREKGTYGFVEFATVEETEKALGLDGMNCLGVPLKISRPNDYSQTSSTQQQAMAAMGMQSAAQLAATQMMNQPPAPPGAPPGASGAQDEAAMAAAAKAAAMALQAAQAAAGAIGGGGPTLEAPKEAPKSKCLRLISVVNPEHIENNSEWDEVMSDMKDGCGSFGKLARHCIVTPHNKTAEVPLTPGDVLMEFQSGQEVWNVMQKMMGRKYDGKQLQMVSMTQSEFDTYYKAIDKINKENGHVPPEPQAAQ